MTDSSKKLLGMSPDEVAEVAAAAGLRPFAARQIVAWLYQKRATDLEQMTDIPKRARAWLADNGYFVGREKPKMEARSTDGTCKYLFEGVGGRDVEAVYIPDKDRATLCVSSQAGCRMGCRFCMTGQGGFQGNLDAGAIVNQILSIPRSESLTNIVFMGMGEPTDNLQAVLRAIDILTAKWGMAWSPRRITVSTIGNPRGVKEILEKTQVHLAVSIHSPFALERERLMPVEKAFPMRSFLPMLREHDFAHQRRLSVEYTMFAGINDDDRHADALVRILKDTDARVNLIRFHRTPGFEGRPSDQATMERFRDRLNQAGITATIRASRGEDIMAACGMLAGSKYNPQTSENNE